MKKQGVKKGTAPENPLKQIYTLVNAYNARCDSKNKMLVLTTVEEQYKQDENIRHHSRVWMSDMITMSLGRMGFREKRYQQLDDTLTQVVTEFFDDFNADYKDDPEMVYARSCFERELKSYTGKLYKPESERY